MISLIVLGVLIILSPIIIIAYVMYINRHLAKLPGPLAIPFVGYKLPTNAKEIFNMLEDMVKNYGETTKLYVGILMRVPTAELSVIEYLTKSNIHMRKSLLYDLIIPWIGEGLLISVGAKWFKMRKMLTPSFHFNVLHGFLEIMEEASNTFVIRLTEQVGKSSVNILNFTQRYSLDIITETSMGIKLQSQNYENQDFVDATNTYLELNMEKGFSWWKVFDLPYRLFAKDYPRSQECLKILHDLSEKVITNKYKQERTQTTKAETVDEFGKKRRKALVDTLFENRISENLSDKDIQAEIDTFLFEGFDTVSRALAFGFYELGQHPDVQQRLYEEIVATIGDDPEPLTQNKIQEMKYLDMVVKEVMRHRSSVPFVERQLEEDAIIDGKFYPKGTVFSLLIYWIHRNPKYFPNPEKFDPERFSPENASKIPNFAYVPFSAGPRNCIGQRFALLELKAAIIHVIKELEILPVPGHKLDLVFNSLLDSKTHILVRMKKREKI